MYINLYMNTDVEKPAENAVERDMLPSEIIFNNLGWWLGLLLNPHLFYGAVPDGAEHVDALDLDVAGILEC